MAAIAVAAISAAYESLLAWGVRDELAREWHGGAIAAAMVGKMKCKSVLLKATAGAKVL